MQFTSMHIMYSSSECIELYIVWSRLRFSEGGKTDLFATAHDSTFLFVVEYATSAGDRCKATSRSTS